MTQTYLSANFAERIMRAHPGTFSINNRILLHALLAPLPEAAAELFKCRFVCCPSVVVRRRRPSTFSCNLPFLQNCSATFLLITHTASISCQLSSMKIWTPLKNSKGPLGPLKGPTRRPKMHIFTHYAYFLKKV